MRFCERRRHWPLPSICSQDGRRSVMKTQRERLVEVVSAEVSGNNMPSRPPPGARQATDGVTGLAVELANAPARSSRSHHLARHHVASGVDNDHVAPFGWPTAADEAQPMPLAITGLHGVIGNPHHVRARA